MLDWWEYYECESFAVTGILRELRVNKSTRNGMLLFSDLSLWIHAEFFILHTRSAISRTSWGRYGARTLSSWKIWWKCLVNNRRSMWFHSIEKHWESIWYFELLGITAALVVRAGNPFMMTVLETSSFSNRCSFLEPSPRLSMSLPESLSRSLWFPLLSSPLDLFSPVMWFPKRITPFLIRCERIQICYNINNNGHKKQVAWLTIVMIIMPTIVWTSTTPAIMPIRSSVVWHCQYFCKTESMVYYQLLQFRPDKKYVDIIAAFEITSAVTQVACSL